MTRRFEDMAAYAAPVIFVVLWASGFVSGKYGLPYAEPFTFLSLRMIAVVAILGLIVLLMRPPWPNETAVRHSIVIGFLMHGCYLGGVFYSIYRGLPPALSALIVCLQPIVTSTVANRVLGEHVTPRQWGGLVLGLIGVLFVVYGNIHGGGDAPVSAWIAAFIGLAGITAGTLFQKRFGGAIDWRPNFLIQYASAGVLFCAGAVLFESNLVYWNVRFIGALAWTVFVLSLGAIWLLYYLIERSAATRVTSLFYLVPPITAIQAFVIFGDQLDKLSIAGIAACAAGVFLVNAAPRVDVASERSSA